VVLKGYAFEYAKAKLHRLTVIHFVLFVFQFLGAYPPDLSLICLARHGGEVSQYVEHFFTDNTWCCSQCDSTATSKYFVAQSLHNTNNNCLR